MINTINIVPRYAETDKMGIVHHSVYAIWYDWSGAMSIRATREPWMYISEDFGRRSR